MNNWLSFHISFPINNAVRLHALRVLKNCGARFVRHGVYIIPDRQTCCATLDALAAEMQEMGGTSVVLRVEEPEGANFTAFFDCSQDYAELVSEVLKAQVALSTTTVQDSRQQARKLRKTFSDLSVIDFFPGEAQRRADTLLLELELACAHTRSPDEPQAIKERKAPL